MKLADLTRAGFIARWIRNLAIIAAVLALGYAALVERKNALLTESNLALVRMLDEQMGTQQARIDAINASQAELRQALLTGESVDSILRNVEDR